jgi:hypothetical protein
LQNQGGCDLIYDFAVFLAGVAGFVENLVGFAGGEALVPKMDGETAQFAKLVRKNLRFGCLGAGIAGKMDRVSYDNAHDVEPPRQPCERTQVLAGAAFAFERQDRLRGNAQFVRHGYADAAVANVEAEVAGFGGSFQVPGPDHRAGEG